MSFRFFAMYANQIMAHLKRLFLTVQFRKYPSNIFHTTRLRRINSKLLSEVGTLQILRVSQIFYGS